MDWLLEGEVDCALFVLGIDSAFNRHSIVVCTDTKSCGVPVVVLVSPNFRHEEYMKNSFLFFLLFSLFSLFSSCLQALNYLLFGMSGDQLSREHTGAGSDMFEGAALHFALTI
jgi:hypothetical protein